MDEIAHIPAEVMAKAMDPPLRFGRGLLEQDSRSWGEYILVTMPEIWEIARPMLAFQPAHTLFVESMDRTWVEGTEKTLPATDTVVGIGGGMVLDMAKYIAWQREIEPVLAPSIASVDACVTNTVAVRDEGRVRYIGFVVPKVVLTDFDLMQSAPLHLNRAGIGDILSIHTGRWDWKAAADQDLIDYDEQVAQGVAELVDQLEHRVDQIRTVSEEGLRWLIEAYAAENKLCLQVGHSRPEEGSEHFFAYNLEHRTGGQFVHGELVCLGILLMSRLQENQVKRVQRILNDTAVRFQPADLDLSRLEVKATLNTLPAYVESEGLPYSVINRRLPDPDLVKAICQDLQF